MTGGTHAEIGIAGVGSALPAAVAPTRPALAPSAESPLFTGGRTRTVLAPGETAEDLAVGACRRALEEADVSAAQVDLLSGYVTVPEFLSPNGLFRVHRDLGLGRHTTVVPVNSEFGTFVMALALAWESMRAGRFATALVAVAAGWSRHVDPRNAHAGLIGDGAGAAVLRRAPRLVIIDWICDTDSAEYGAMTMACADGTGRPTYRIEPDSGVAAFRSTGMDGPPDLVHRLLDRNGVPPGKVTVIGHQASDLLLDHWRRRLHPARVFDTLNRYGNLVIASAAVTLDAYAGLIDTPYLVLFGLGIGSYQIAMLIRM
ncbi:3-oxoacyl-ACP synthase [Microbispora cellulosiformans]|uniref:3-oxoacyl-ACP synthase n=1 Tax=Microbispora cellulosiformans TaxID=2614688 RepID=A0A5J5K2F1_9ACTN|nr:3-oxoacyl-ACP synthase [Microbispora cellulosiformans]KAA9377731.1 3-oxoacyl-ACP synthase [Microbispora cellulosiformans]